MLSTVMVVNRTGNNVHVTVYVYGGYKDLSITYVDNSTNDVRMNRNRKTPNRKTRIPSNIRTFTADLVKIVFSINPSLVC